MVFINDCFGTSIHLLLSYLMELHVTTGGTLKFEHVAYVPHHKLCTMPPNIQVSKLKTVTFIFIF
jgi:hypothetical protein